MRNSQIANGLQLGERSMAKAHRRRSGQDVQRAERWTPLRAALYGSSYLQLPRILQWFTGNIGFHHVHRLMPRVPNYRLQACHEALLALGGGVRTLTLGGALRAPSFALWNETHGRQVHFQADRRAAQYGLQGASYRRVS